MNMVNYWPTRDMDAYLRLENRVMARMALVDATASGSDDPFSEEDLIEGVQLELNFRDRQLLRIQEEILDLDDLADNVVMSDLSMDYFLAQLRQYLESHKQELEATPSGAYAITPAPQDGSGPGVLFMLRQHNATPIGARQQAASPVHPFYMVYVKNDGSIRYGCATARQALQTFESAAIGKTQPIQNLCDRFDRDTDHGQEMSLYDSLVDRTIAHIRQTLASRAARGLGQGGSPDYVLPKVSETPKDSTDFELVTWLILV